MKLRPPNLPRLARYRDRAVPVVLLLLAPAAALAQTTATPATAPADDEVVVLSPFTVDASKDEGYRATSTLAGSRINTSLRDIAASITEITPEFLRDVGAVDINDVLTYTAGTESTRNFTDAPSQGIGGFADRSSTNSQTANRIRGLNAATLTRDYFISIGAGVGFDAYNVDRISINRGPNSILFGLGDPSGVVNYSPKVARVDQHANEVSVRYGSNDDLRASVDFNYVLLPKKLALRVEGLWTDRGFQQEPAYFKDKRVNLEATYKPFAGTTLQVAYERVRQRVNNPNTITPLDMVTGWVAAGSPTWDPRTDNWSSRPANFNSTAGGTAVGATAPNGSLEYTFQEGAGERYWATWWQPNTPGVSVYNTIAVSDSKYVPLWDMNLSNTISNSNLDTFTASWDQQITPDLFLNVAYLNENLNTVGHNWIRSNQYGIFVDVNKYLPDGTANPHFGETYMPQRSLDSMSRGNQTNEAIRGTVTYNLDLTREKGWAHWLGRHVFTGFGEHRLATSLFNGYNGTRSGDPAYLQKTDRINPGDWQLTRLRYLGGTATTQAKYAPGEPHMFVSGVPNTYFDSASGTWGHDTYADYYALKRRDLNENTVKSMAGIWQGYLLDGRIVGTFGLRHDENSVAAKSSTQIDPKTGFLTVDDTLGPTSVIAGNTKTYGVVVHPLKWLSLHYNRSENFVPQAGDVDIFGKPLGPPSGEGKDYGFSVDLMEGKLSVRVNWYELSSTNARLGFTAPVIEAQWELPWFDQVVIPELAKKYGLTHNSSDFFSTYTWGDSHIAETADQVSKGTEVEVIYNPTRNWRVMATVTKGKASQSNIAPGLTKWVKEVLPTWQSQPWFNGVETYDAGWGFSGNLQGYFNQFNTARNLATYKAFEGQTVQELREWHVSVINNYQFTSGALKGWNVGGVVRWESEAAIGYPAVLTDGLLTGLDLNRAYTDGGNYYVDAWVGYTRKIYRDKVIWNVQLNVRDLTESNGLRPIVANSDGTASQFRILFGPTWYLSSTFNF